MGRGGSFGKKGEIRFLDDERGRLEDRELERVLDSRNSVAIFDGTTSLSGCVQGDGNFQDVGLD